MNFRYNYTGRKSYKMKLFFVFPPKPSYVDTMSRVRLLKDEVSFYYVGRLSVRDRIGLAEFIELRLDVVYHLESKKHKLYICH